MRLLTALFYVMMLSVSAWGADALDSRQESIVRVAYATGRGDLEALRPALDAALAIAAPN